MPTLDKRTAKELASICLWAYDFDESKKETQTLFGGNLPVQVAVVHDEEKPPTSYAAILEYSDVVVIAFQGTITEFKRDGEFSLPTLKDWIVNFMVKQVESAESTLPGKVHSGFLKQLNMIYKKVENSLPENTDKPIVLTGHSQGGAVAVLAAKRLEQKGLPVREVYTFGAPRPGNQEFVANVNTPVFRIEFGNDLVPHVPPATSNSSLLMNVLDLTGLDNMAERLQGSSYQSIGDLTYADEDEYRTEMDEKQEGKLLTKRKARLVLAGSELASDHGLENYIGMFDV